MTECNLTTCKHIADLERELAEVRSCMRYIVETWDEEPIENIEDGSCRLMGPGSIEMLARWRIAAGLNRREEAEARGT